MKPFPDDAASMDDITVTEFARALFTSPCLPEPTDKAAVTHHFFWYFPELPVAHTHGAPPVSYMWRAGLVRHRYVYIHLAH
jgi:hypothetical protein